MELEITRGKPKWANGSKSYRNKVVVMVKFPNCVNTKSGDDFVWIPKYDDLMEILKCLHDNEEECRLHDS